MQLNDLNRRGTLRLKLKSLPQMIAKKLIGLEKYIYSLNYAKKLSLKTIMIKKCCITSKSPCFKVGFIFDKTLVFYDR